MNTNVNSNRGLASLDSSGTYDSETQSSSLSPSSIEMRESPSEIIEKFEAFDLSRTPPKPHNYEELKLRAMAGSKKAAAQLTDRTKRQILKHLEKEMLSSGMVSKKELKCMDHWNQVHKNHDASRFEYQVLDSPSRVSRSRSLLDMVRKWHSKSKSSAGRKSSRFRKLLKRYMS